MKHTVSSVKVYKTEDYKIFRFREGNRETNKKKQDKIIKEIESGNDILDESPILVFEDGKHLNIEDGQNRFLIAKALKRPVHYIIKKQQLSLYNLAKINSNVEKWSAKDFINCYSKAGNANYKKLGEFHKAYGISVGVCLSMLTYGVQKGDGGGEKLLDAFQQGIFEIKKEKEARHLAEICKSFEAFPAWNSRGFILAITKILQADQCDFDVLLKKFKRDPSKLTTQSNWKGYITNLEVIYNYDNSKRRTIY
jgi:hypothetical protein